MGYNRAEPGRTSVNKDNVANEDFIRQLVEVSKTLDEADRDPNIPKLQEAWHKMESAKRTFERVQERVRKDLDRLRDNLKRNDPSLIR